MRVLVGGCVPVGEGALPYAPIVEALRALLTEVGVSTVRELVGPSWPELARLLPALGEPDRTGPAQQARLFELLLGLLERLSGRAPLVLAVEDLHWADQSTRDLLAFLVRNLRRERVLLVVTYRNDEPGQQQLGPYLAEKDPGQAGGGRSRRGGRDRPPTRPRQAMIRRPRAVLLPHPIRRRQLWGVTHAFQGLHDSLLNLAVSNLSPPSNALYDHCATEHRRPSWPRQTGEHAGQGAALAHKHRRDPSTSWLTSDGHEAAGDYG
jgi:AAA ATPase domain